MRWGLRKPSLGLEGQRALFGRIEDRAGTVHRIHQDERDERRDLGGHRGAGYVDAFPPEVVELTPPEGVAGDTAAEGDPSPEASQGDGRVRGRTSPLTNHPVDPDLHVGRHGKRRAQQKVGRHEPVTQDARGFLVPDRDGEGGGAWIHRISGA
jgi:hypothetical protein